jgi:site-specific DNA-methyltransferase (adenine-specific)
MKVTDKIYIENCDNMELMARYPDNYFDLAIVDPPYGIDIAKWDKLEMRPKKEYWKQLFRVSKNQIVWGGNYFTDFLPVSRGWLCWDKSVVEAGYLGKKEYDNFELAWISKDVKTKMIRFSDIGNMSGFDGKLKVDYTFKGKIHPTQKHKNLYKWLLDNYAKPNDKILDTHLGSGSIAIACHDYGFELTACELDKEYFDKAIERIKNHTNQQKLF